MLPNLTVWMVADPGVPPKSTLDPEILLWCELNKFILVTNICTSVLIQLNEHLAQKRHIPGIFVFRRRSTIKQIVDDLILNSSLIFLKFSALQ